MSEQGWTSSNSRRAMVKGYCISCYGWHVVVADFVTVCPRHGRPLVALLSPLSAAARALPDPEAIA